jgi:hypothetical protein
VEVARPPVISWRRRGLDLSNGAAHDGVRERVGVDAAEAGGVAGVGACVVVAEWRSAGRAEREHDAAPLVRLRSAAQRREGTRRGGGWRAAGEPHELISGCWGGAGALHDQVVSGRDGVILLDAVPSWSWGR